MSSIHAPRIAGKPAETREPVKNVDYVRIQVDLGTFRGSF